MITNYNNTLYKLLFSKKHHITKVNNKLLFNYNDRLILK